MFPDLLLELHADGVGLLQEDGVAPQQVPQGGELVRPPLAEAPHGQLHLLRRPLDWGLPWKHNVNAKANDGRSETSRCHFGIGAHFVILRCTFYVLDIAS